MLDGRFDPEFFRSLAEGQVSTSDLAPEYEALSVDPLVVRGGLGGLVTVIALCAARLT